MSSMNQDNVIEFESGLDPNRWKALAVIAIASLMVVLDASIVNIALPQAQKALHISNANRQWVVTAYSLAFGSLLLFGGRLSDFIGRKRIFMIGLGGFAFASAIGGLSQTSSELFAARAVQGAFGALLAPAALSLISVTFTIPKERAKAFGVYGAISGGGAAIGLIMGGLLTEYANWRWCLLVNTPIAILAILLAIPFIRESRAQGDRSYDIPGTIISSLGLVSLVYGCAQAATHGWGNIHTYIFFIISAVLLAIFSYVETKTTHPLLPLRIFTERNRGGSYLSAFLVGAGLFAIFLFLSIYFQQFLGYSSLRSGFAFLPFSGGIIAFAGVASQLLPKIGPRPLMTIGLLAAVVGLWLFSHLTDHSHYASQILPAMIITASGIALFFIPSASTGLHNAGEHDTGVASAVLNTSQQIGGSLGAALLNTVAISSTTSYFISHIAKNGKGASANAIASVHGFDIAFLTGAAFLFVAAVASFALINVGKESVVENPSGAMI